MLATHGAEDAVVRQSVLDQYRVSVPHAQIDVMAGAGHAAFWDDAAAFNRRLATFASQVSRREPARRFR